MRSTLIPIFLCIAALTSCDSADKTPADAKTSDAAAKAGDKVKKETKEAAVAVRDYAFAQKADFVAEMKPKLAAIEVEIKALEAKVAASTGEAKADAQAKLDTLREKWAATKTRLDAAEAANESNWETVKNDAKQAQKDLETSFDDTRQWLSDKIAPSP